MLLASYRQTNWSGGCVCEMPAPGMAKAEQPTAFVMEQRRGHECMAQTHTDADTHRPSKRDRVSESDSDREADGERVRARCQMDGCSFG